MLTVTTVAVGVGAHLLAGGPVTIGGVVAAVPVLLGLFLSLTDRERGWLPIAGAQLAEQQVVHSLLELGASHMHAAPMSGAMPADLFFYGHFLAAALVATWLRCGERRAWAAARRAVLAVAACWQHLLTLLGHRPPSAPKAAPAVVTATLPRRHAALRHTVVRRGPPALV